METEEREGSQVLRAGVLWHFASFKLQSETVDTSAPDTKQALARFFIRTGRRGCGRGGKGSKKREPGTASRNDGNAQLSRSR